MSVCACLTKVCAHAHADMSVCLSTHRDYFDPALAGIGKLRNRVYVTVTYVFLHCCHVPTGRRTHTHIFIYIHIFNPLFNTAPQQEPCFRGEHLQSQQTETTKARSRNTGDPPKNDFRTTLLGVVPYGEPYLTYCDPLT